MRPSGSRFLYSHHAWLAESEDFPTQKFIPSRRMFQLSVDVFIRLWQTRRLDANVCFPVLLKISCLHWNLKTDLFPPPACLLLPIFISHLQSKDDTWRMSFSWYWFHVLREVTIDVIKKRDLTYRSNLKAKMLKTRTLKRKHGVDVWGLNCWWPQDAVLLPPSSVGGGRKWEEQ